jgi:hypothetical protein
MNRIEWEEQDEDEDGCTSFSLIVITDDNVLKNRMRRMLRSLVENDKTLSSVPIGKKDKEE